jgi:transcription initiation factor IIE alpha subunit
MDEMMENKIYVCPMHHDETSDKPGTCPICGMDLVLMEEMEETEESDM